MAPRSSRRSSNLRSELAASFLHDDAALASSAPDPADFSDSDSDSDDDDHSFTLRLADMVPEGIDASLHKSLESLGSSRSAGAMIMPKSSDATLPTVVSKDGSESPEAEADGSGPVDGAASPGGSPGTDKFSLAHRRRSTSATIEASQERTTRNLDDPNELAAHVAAKVQRNFELKCSEGLRTDGGRRTSAVDILAPFQSKEIVLGKLLGSGEFSHAYEIKSFNLRDVLRDGEKDDEDDGDDAEEHVLIGDSKSGSSADRTLFEFEVSAREDMVSRERYQETTKGHACHRYALKHLRPKLIERYDTLDYAQAASDLAMEAEFLRRIVHPNIIKIR